MGRGRRNKPNKPKKPLTSTSHGTTLCPSLDTALLSRWPKLNNKIPPIFLHKPADLGGHVRNLLNLNIQFYKPLLGQVHTKIKCASLADYREMITYFDRNHLPYHTYGMPGKRKMRVVIKGLPAEIDEEDIMSELKFLSVPVIRIHRMQTKVHRIRPAMFLVVVSHDEHGYKMLRVQNIFNYPVILEPPRERPKQCHRCQQWGHAQRYCHGKIKCVKCAGPHFSNRCPMNKAVPPKCANCEGRHTANFKDCHFCPMSTIHKSTQATKKARNGPVPPSQGDDLVSFENAENMYRNSYVIEPDSDSDIDYDIQFLL